MEALTRLVADSLARHGLDRPIDTRRLQWSRWFRCDSPHSLLIVPSKPGIFALAEEVMDLGASNPHVGTAAPGCPPERGSATASTATIPAESTVREGHDFSSEPALSKRSAPKGAVMPARNPPASAAEVPRRMLAVLQFSEDDDMAFTLDRMFTCANPMRARLVFGSCFLRFVVIEDTDQRRSICTALNQWMRNSAEKATGLPADFSSSLELAPVTERVGGVGRTLPPDSAGSAPKSTTTTTPALETDLALAPHLDSGANSNRHCPHPLPSGF